MKKFLLLISFVFAIFIRIDSGWAGDCGLSGKNLTNTRIVTIGYARINGEEGSNESTYGLTTPGEWVAAVAADQYCWFGMATCNKKIGTSTGDTAVLSPESSGKYCWCQITAKMGVGGLDRCTISPAPNLWVYMGQYTSESDCLKGCAYKCPYTFKTQSSFRNAMSAAAVPGPETVDLTFDNGAAMSCTVGDTFVPPAPAPRTGMVFTGWKIRPKLDFSTIDTSTNGSERWAKGVYNNADICYHDTTTGNTTNVGCNSDNNFSELQQYDWKVKFSHGSAYGIAGCATNGGTYAQPGTPTIANGSGTYCWCKATGYKANNATVSSAPESALSWVFNENNNTATNCAQYCAFSCTYHEEFSSSFRTALYTPASN